LSGNKFKGFLKIKAIRGNEMATFSSE